MPVGKKRRRYSAFDGTQRPYRHHPKRDAILSDWLGGMKPTELRAKHKVSRESINSILNNSKVRKKDIVTSVPEPEPIQHAVQTAKRPSLNLKKMEPGRWHIIAAKISHKTPDGLWELEAVWGLDPDAPLTLAECHAATDRGLVITTHKHFGAPGTAYRRVLLLARLTKHGERVR